MKLVTHVSFNNEAKKEEVEAKKEGDEEIARDWKDHNEDFLLMHGKVNQIASGLGIFLYFLEMEHQLGGGSSRKSDGRERIAWEAYTHNMQMIQCKPLGFHVMTLFLIFEGFSLLVFILYLCVSFGNGNSRGWDKWPYF